MTINRRYLISGRVQGVFFRDSTQRQARSLGLGGWVRNRRDGRVEVLLCGDEEGVEEMEKWLQNGPEHAKVSTIECIKDESTGCDPRTGFDIKTTV